MTAHMSKVARKASVVSTRAVAVGPGEAVPSRGALEEKAAPEPAVPERTASGPRRDGEGRRGLRAGSARPRIRVRAAQNGMCGARSECGRPESALRTPRKVEG